MISVWNVQYAWLLATAVWVGFAPASTKGEGAGIRAALSQEFDLGKARSHGTRYFDMMSTTVGIGPDGKRGDRESFHLKLECRSTADAGRTEVRYTCRRLEVVKADGTRATIPSLEGWTYSPSKTRSGLDERGFVFGIDHSKFQGLTDSNGDPIAPMKSYLIYNAFIDFHSFFDVFAAPANRGKGIQHLTRIGHRIVHVAAHSTPPTNLAGSVKTGSHFKNGEITLTLKGLGIADDAACAIVEFDSGDSSFQMKLEPAPGMEVKTDGGSHYFGDMYIDLSTHWPRRVEMREFVVCRTTVPMPGGATPRTVDAIQERHVVVRSMTKEAFEQE